MFSACSCDCFKVEIGGGVAVRQNSPHSSVPLFLLSPSLGVDFQAISRGGQDLFLALCLDITLGR